MSKVLKAAVLTAILVVAGLAATEGALRVFGYVPDGTYIPRYYAGVPGDLEPNMTMYEAVYPERKYLVTTTPQGTRGLRPFSPQKPGGTLRVLCLGNSYTYSAGVADTDSYPEQLARELEARYPTVKFDVINAGISMFGLLDEIDYYLEKGRFLSPDVVVLQFYATDFQNHVRGIILREAHRLRSPFSKRSLASSWLGWSKIYQWYAAVSPFWAGINSIYYPLPPLKFPGEGFDPAMDSFRFTPTADEASFGPDRDKLLARADSPEFSRVVEAYFSALDRFRNILAKNGTQLLFVILPDRWQVDGYRNAVNRVMARQTARLKVDAIDMTSAFRASLFRLGLDPYLENGEDHCDPYGNRLVARTVADALLAGRDGQGKPFILVRPQRPLFDYGDPIRVRLWVDKNGLVKPEAPQGVHVRVESASNLAVQEESSVAINVLRPAAVDHPGEMVLRVDPGTPVRRLDVRLPRKMDDDPAGLSSARTLVSSDGTDWRLVDDPQNDRSGRSGSFEQHAIVECPFRKNHPSTIWLKIRLAGQAEVYTERPGKAKPERYFELYLYPPPPMGS